MLANLIGAALNPRGLALLTLLCFSLSLPLGFIYDDALLIAENPHAQSFEHVGRAFTSHFWDTGGSNDPETLRYYRPLVALSYIVDWQLGGGAAWMFHLTNSVLHALTVLLAARFMQRLFHGSAVWLLPTLLFAFHPTRIESVVWIAGRTDVMMMLCLLLGLEAAARARSRASLPALLGCCVCLAAALLSKETAVVFPLLLLADRAANQKPPSARHWARRHADVFAASALVVGYLLLRAMLFPVGAPALTFTPLSFLAALEGYAERLVWPWPAGFFFRPLRVDGGGLVHAPWQLALGALVAAGALWLLGHAFHRQRAAFWSLLAAFAGLLPLLHLVPTGLPVLVADRFWYFPLLPLTGALALLYQRQLERALESRGAAAVLLLPPAALLGTLAITLPDWVSPEVFWSSEVERDPCNPAAREHLAKRAAAHGDLEQARAHLAFTLRPDCLDRTLAQRHLPLRAYARVLELEAAMTADGDTEKLRAIYQHLEQLHAGTPKAEPLIADRTQPAQWFFDHLREHPRAIPDTANLAAELGAIATRLGRDGVARRWCERAERADSRQLAAPANLVLTLARLGEFERARSLLGRLARATPAPLLGKTQALDLQNRLDEASQLLKLAARREPLERRMLQAQAQATLGAYGRALTILEPAYREHPEAPVGALYVQLLVAARLERDAYRALTRTQPPERARRIVETLRSSLAPALAGIPAIELP